ncbi:MAG: hypothetical protein IT191_02730 [Microbacteriaceae bacterium]|nr:hypothetical protein [Cryobacterium sp.]MBX3104405.1 hypothetical protein [Cryobacterium sp.]MCC6375911.1 hypothetical protein [Microbacteriaceae bacterium]
MSNPHPNIESVLYYQPTSWIDAIARFVRRKNISWWLVLLFLALVWLILFTLSRLKENPASVSIFDQGYVGVFFSATPLPAYGVITSAAGRAFDRFIPALGKRPSGVDESRRRLTAIPLIQSIVVGLLGAAIGIVSLFTTPAYQTVYFTSTPTLVLGIIAFAFSYGAILTVIWQTIRTVNEVVRLHRRAEVIDVDRPGPAHAFSSVTAAAASFILVVLAFSIATTPKFTETLPNFLLSAIAGLVAIAIFVLPLIRMRGRMIDAKHAEIDSVGARINAVMQEIETAVDQKRFKDVEALSSTMTALNDRADRLRKVSTWPWDARVTSGFLSALLIPVATWAITVYAGRFLGV